MSSPSRCSSPSAKAPKPPWRRTSSCWSNPDKDPHPFTPLPRRGRRSPALSGCFAKRSGGERGVGVRATRSRALPPRDPAPADSVLVIGGGVGGMRAAIDLAEAGLHTYLVETSPALGGRVAQLGFMFPTHDCVLCRGAAHRGLGWHRPP